MDNWTDKKFSLLWEKLAYTHKTDSLASTILEFTSLAIYGFLEKNGLMA